MNEEKTVETESQEASYSEPTVLESLIKETFKMIESAGKAFASAIQDTSELMVIDIDAETRKHLDVLVKSGVVNSRREAASVLLKEGLKHKEDLIEKIENTNAKIADLRQKLRTLSSAQS